ncbi:hypothetical protein FRC03_001956 [Tulasnella sp. 419]|nr:hypothetical protein FRC03_001956 [Tulasnella sp. 419]
MSQFVDEASQITGFTTTSGNGGGTDRFMCPELLEDEPKTTATDMWACGCLVWLILTDEIPYGHIVRKHAIPFAIMRGDKPIAQRNDTVDASLWAFISECWNRDPNQRPTALDLGLHLKSLLGSRTLFHLQSLRHTQSLESPHRNIRSMRFSPDGRFLAVVAGDNNVSIWNFEMGSISSSYFRILNVEETAQAVFWSKSQYYLLVETSFSVQIWAIETGQRSARLQSATLATWLPDSVAFSYVTLSGIFVKDLSDSSTKNMSIDVGTQELLAVIFAPDNTRVLVLTAGATPQTSNSDKAVLTIHNQVTSKVERSITFPVIPSGISLSRDGRFILVAHYKEAPEVWEIRVKGVPASETVELSYLHKYQAESGTKNYHKVHFGGFRDQFVIAKLRDGPITIWDRDTAGILHSIPIPLINQPTGLTSMSNCAEADNLMLAVGVGGGSMQVWAASQQSNGSSAVVESSFQGIGAVQR